MPLNTSKNSETSLSLVKQLQTKYRIYGFYWTVKLTIQYLYRKLIFEILQKSYSQYGEDLIISRLLKSKKIFYVDIGANHPQKFNNTYFFYLHGSQGINIEPNPLLMNQYSDIRQRDINLNIGISDSSGLLKFYQMFPDVNSTFSEKQYQHNLKNNSILVSTPNIKVSSLSAVLDKHLSNSDNFDLLSIDTEGHDLTVLKSNDWNKYRPKVICVETQSSLSLHQYLLKLGYKLVQKTPINSLYVQKNSSLLSLSTTI
jgi:FkbM family methyltransferase